MFNLLAMHLVIFTIPPCFIFIFSLNLHPITYAWCTGVIGTTAGTTPFAPPTPPDDQARTLEVVTLHALHTATLKATFALRIGTSQEIFFVVLECSCPAQLEPIQLLLEFLRHVCLFSVLH